MLTSKQYVSLRGRICPACQKPTIARWSPCTIKRTLNKLSQTVHCIYCKTMWEEQYELFRITSVTERKGNGNSALQEES